MKQGLTKWRVAGIIFIFVLLLAAVFGSQKVQEKKTPTPVEEKKLQVLGDLKPKDKSPENLPEDQTIDFAVNGRSSLTYILATEPGMYPAKRIESDKAGRVSKSFFDVFTGEFEILIRQVDVPGAAFWGALSSAPGDDFRLKPASALSLTFVDNQGQAVEGATVKLGRGRVSLLWVEGITDEDGMLSFPNIPKGSYILRARKADLNAEKKVVHGDHDGAFLLESTTLYEVKGKVVDEEGQGLPDALVESYNVREYASDIVRTDLFGNFSLRSSQPKGRLVIRHSKFVTAHGTFNLGGDNILELKRGKQVGVFVTDPQGSPVGGALVSWSQEGSEEIGEAKSSKGDGSIVFEGVPKDALFTGFLGGFKSHPTSIQEGQKVALTLLGEVDLRKRIRFRMTTPNRVKVIHVSAHQGNSECDVRATSDRDFELSGCPEGEFEMRVQTQKGIVEFQTRLVEGIEINLDAPLPRVIKMKGVPSEKWGQTNMFIVFGSTKRPIQFDLLSSEEAQWEGDLYPGSYSIIVENNRIGERRYVVDTREDDEFLLSLKALQTFRFWVIDDHQSPVNNAYMMLWRGTTLIDVASSSGQLPSEFREENEDELHLLVLDPQRGEAGGEVADLPEHVVLGETIGSFNFPKNRIKKEDLKEELGLSFSEKDRGFLMKVDADSKAAEIGLMDGDFWLIAYLDAGGRVQVIVYRAGEYKVSSFESTRF